VLVRGFVPGRPLKKRTRTGDDFFPRLLALMQNLHARGVAYVDLEKPDNVILGEGGQPYLIDFQTAFFLPRKFLGETSLARALCRQLQRSDLYHLMKHWRRMRPDQLTPQQVREGRSKPLLVRLGNVVTAPYKKLRRWLRRKPSRS